MLFGLALAIALIGASATASQNQDADESDPTAHSWTVETVWQLEIPTLDRKHRHLWTPELERARFIRTRTDHVLVPQVSAEEFQTFCDELGLDDARRTVAQMLFDEYIRNLNDVRRQAYRVRPLGTTRDSPSDDVRPEQFPPIWHEIDRVFDALMSDLQSLAPDDETDAWRTAIRGLKRQCILNDWRVFIGHSRAYAGDWFNLTAEVLAAAADIPALRADGESEDITRGDLHLDIREILDRYEAELDQQWPQLVKTYREARATFYAAFGKDDWSMVERAWRQDAGRWKQFYDLNQRYVGEIEENLMRRSVEEAAAWRKHAMRAIFREVYRNRLGKLREWLAEQDFPPTQRAQIDQAWQVFERDVEAQERRMIQGTLGLRRGSLPDEPARGVIDTAHFFVIKRMEEFERPVINTHYILRARIIEILGPGFHRPVSDAFIGLWPD